MTSIRFCTKELGMNPSTAVHYNNYVSELFAEDLLHNPVQIGDSGNIVVIDDKAVSSKRKYNRSRMSLEKWAI